MSVKGTERVRERVRERERQPDFLREISPDNGRALIRREREVEREVETFSRPRKPSPSPPVVVRERELIRERDREPGSQPSLMKGTHAVLGPSSIHDTTIHLQLDVEEDLETHLEEFSRLKRLGSFKDAEEYFQTNLHEFINVPPVSVEYADMLLTQGAYKRLKALRQKNELKRPPGPDDVLNRVSVGKKIEKHALKLVEGSDSESSSGTSQDEEEVDQVKNSDGDPDRFDITFPLIEASSYMFSQGWLAQALKACQAAVRTSPAVGHKLTSTSVHTIVLSLNILSYVEDESSLVDYYDYYRIAQDWALMYNRLLGEGRIWEVRDLISACLPAFGARRTWRKLFDVDLHSPDFFKNFLREWKVNDYDTSTYLAILDILVALGQYLVSSSDLSSKQDRITTAKRCLEQARDLAARIKENDPEYIKSRPYIQWILVQEELSRKLGYEEGGTGSRKPALSFQYLQKFPGITMWASSLPIYVPAQAENPGWPVSHLPESDNELLHVALRASEELRDYGTQVLCLRELICRSKEPTQLFDKLMHLQRTVQGDIIGYLQTCLSKYLYATTEESRQALIDDLADFDGRQAMSFKIGDPLMLWLERRVQSALYLSRGLATEAENAQKMAKILESDLPNDVRSAISRLFLSSATDPDPVIKREVIYHRAPHVETHEPSARNPVTIVKREREPREVETRETYVRAPTGKFERETAVFDGRERPGIDTEIDVRVRDRQFEPYNSATGKFETEEEFFLERERPKIEKPFVSTALVRRDPFILNDLSIEEVRRDFPPPRGADLARRDFPPPPVADLARRFSGTSETDLADAKEGLQRLLRDDSANVVRRRSIEAIHGSDISEEDAIQKDYEDRMFQDGGAVEALTERKAGETEDQYKQRIEADLRSYEQTRERFDLAIKRARSKLDQINKAKVSSVLESKGGMKIQKEVTEVQYQKRGTQKRSMSDPNTGRSASTTREGNGEQAEKVIGGAKNGADLGVASAKTEEQMENRGSTRVREGVRDSSRSTVSMEDEFPKTGITRMPTRLVSRKAVIDLGYPFWEEVGETIVIMKALGNEAINEIIKLSADYLKEDAELSKIILLKKQKGDGDGDDEVVVIEEHAPRPSAAEADDIGAEGLKRRLTFPTSEEVPDDGEP